MARDPSDAVQPNRRSAKKAKPFGFFIRLAPARKKDHCAAVSPLVSPDPLKNKRAALRTARPYPKSLFHQLFHLVEQLSEELERLVDGGGGGHIDPRELQYADGVHRAARGEELLVIRDGGLALGEDPVRNGAGRGEARRILEHVEVIEEVRYALPLVGDLGIDGDRFAEILLVELVILLAEGVGGQGLALFGKLVHEELELGEHGLTIDGAAEAFEEVVDEVSPLALVRRLVKKIPDEQHLVAGGGDLRDEYHVILLADGLVLHRIDGVERVPHLVRDCEHRIQGILLIEQHVGVRIAAGGVRAAALALVLVNVDPAVLEALLEDGDVILAKGLQGLYDYLLRLLIGDLAVGVAHYGGVEIVHVELGNAHQLFAELNVLMQVLEVRVDGVDEVVIHGNGDLRPVESGVEGGFVIPCAGVENEALYLRIEERRRGVLELREGVVEALERGLADLGIGVFHEGDEGALGDYELAAVLIMDGGEFDVRIAECGGRLAGGARHLTGKRKDPLLRIGKGMGLERAQTGELPLVEPELGLGREELFQLLIGDGDELRSGEGIRRADGDVKVHYFPLHALIEGVAGILVGLAHGVIAEALDLDLELVAELQILIDGLRALAQPAAERRDLGGIDLGGLKSLFPCLVGGEKILGSPCVLLFDFGTLGYLLLLCHFVFSFLRHGACFYHYILPRNPRAFNKKRFGCGFLRAILHGAFPRARFFQYNLFESLTLPPVRGIIVNGL